MKRSLNILMALMLSLMVVYLSVGTTVMHCLRYDKVMVGMVADGWTMTVAKVSWAHR